MQQHIRPSAGGGVKEARDRPRRHFVQHAELAWPHGPAHDQPYIARWLRPEAQSLRYLQRQLAADRLMLMEADPAAWLGLLGGRLGDIVQQRGQLEQRDVRIAPDILGKVLP